MEKQETILNVSSCCGQTTKERNLKEDENKVIELPIAVIGAGPVGLAAAAHLVENGENFVVIEAGSRVGNNILQWGHVRLFSSWQYNIDKVAKKLLEKNGWIAPNDELLPTGKELVEVYLEKLANLPEIHDHLLLNTKVISISKKGFDKMKDLGRNHAPFVLYVEQLGVTKRIEAKAVIDATGTWANPNPVNADGIWTPEERALNRRIQYGIVDLQRESERYKGKKVAVIGGGHSAINTLLELTQLGDQLDLYWIMRKNRIEDAYGGEEKDALEARGELGSRIHQLVDEGRIQVLTPFRIYHLQDTGKGIDIMGEYDGKEFILQNVDEIITNTGSRPDFTFLRELRLSIDSATESVEALSPLIDPNLHSCGTVRPHGEEILRQPEQNFYIVGMKSYGRAPTFLMATGYEQVRSIVAYLSGNEEASKRVELELPETGVCSINLEPVKTGKSCSTTC